MDFSGFENPLRNVMEKTPTLPYEIHSRRLVLWCEVSIT